jgi:hypothetical protein
LKNHHKLIEKDGNYFVTKLNRNIQKVIVTLVCALIVVVNCAYAQNSVVVILLFGDEATPLQHVVTVSPSGRDSRDPVAALNSIVGTYQNHYLVLIGPGIYDLEEQLVMRRFVNVVGSGEGVTQLRGSIGHSDAGPDSALIIGSGYSPFSNLSVFNGTGPEGGAAGTTSTGVYNFNVKENLNTVFNMNKVTVVVDGAQIIMAYTMIRLVRLLMTRVF